MEFEVVHWLLASIPRELYSGDIPKQSKIFGSKVPDRSLVKIPIKLGYEELGKIIQSALLQKYKNDYEIRGLITRRNVLFMITSETPSSKVDIYFYSHGLTDVYRKSFIKFRPYIHSILLFSNC